MDQFSNRNIRYDLEERTARYAEQIIDFVKNLKVTVINNRIISQLIGSAGSVGANYCEASESESKKDFIHKISICKKEVKESKHWLRLLKRCDFEQGVKIGIFQNEAQELLLIFSKIIRSCKNKKGK